MRLAAGLLVLAATAIASIGAETSLQEGADGFLWNQRAWTYLSEGLIKEARESFLKAIDRSSTTATQAEANLGLGLAALARSQPKAGMDPLRSALVQGPYFMPAASYETGLIALAMGDKTAALAYLRQGLQVDPLHLESLRALARLYERLGANQDAWRAFSRIASLDPRDEEAVSRVKQLAQSIPEGHRMGMAVRRLSRNLLDPAAKPVVEPSPSSATVRVAMFCDANGASATLTQAYFMSNAPFHILADNGDVIKDDGRAYDLWEILYRPESGLIELRDASRNIQHATRSPFRIVPLNRQGSVLLKSAQFLQTTGFDPGDREVRGTLEARPTPSGFKTVNEAPLEDYLYGAVGAALPQGSPLEAYKAQAVASRTLALWYKSQAAAKQESVDLCDSRKCQRYVGVNEEMREASRGVAETEGLVLRKEGELARALHHEHCGGFTETSSDGPGPLSPATPLQLERFIHDSPPRDRYCEAQTLTSPSDARWMRLLDIKELQQRADRVKPVGALRDLRVRRRTATGRVTALEVVGSRDRLILEGEDAIGDLLSPGSLRSMLFTIQPLTGLRGPVQFIVWGAGTGHGLGLCRAGAVGQATLGRNFRDILAVYFPGCGVGH